MFEYSTIARSCRSSTKFFVELLLADTRIKYGRRAFTADQRDMIILIKSDARVGNFEELSSLKKCDQTNS